MDKSTEHMLVLKARAGDELALDELLNEFKPMVNSIVHGYFLSNGDQDDLYQEGMIGLYKAFLKYDINGDTSFSTFAYLCIKRRVLQVVRASLSSKNAPLHNYLSIDPHGSISVGKFSDDDNGEFFIPSDSPSPIDQIITKESMDELSAKIRSVLSKYEYNVLFLYLKGFSYKQIAHSLDKNPKSVDNAIERVKEKLQFLH